MSGRFARDTLSGTRIDRLLLEAKLMVRPLRPGSVSRAELIGSIRNSDRRVVGITAPAGYGKSTLLAEWAATEVRPLAWLTLDQFDDDPSVLLSLLAAAYAQVMPEYAALPDELRGPGVSALGRAAPRLASALRKSRTPFALLLDDVHELTAPDCQAALSVVIAGIPDGSQLVLASRWEPPLLAQLRAAGDTVEVVAEDLALDAAGAQQLFAEAHLAIGDEVAATLAEQTEGWPVGLHLAAMTARRTGVTEPTISGEDRFVTDYLYRESLSRLPEPTQRFLRRTAVPTQLCASLCASLTGVPDGQQILRELEESAAFLVPVDRRRHWYRYHTLYREFLLGELRRVEPESIMDLQLRAADWYESNGLPTLAFEHLLNTTERQRCAQLATRLMLPLYNAGQNATIERWLTELGDQLIERHPPLAVLAGWVAALGGHTVQAQRWSKIVDAATFDATPTDGTASFESARAMFRALLCAAGPEQMSIDAQTAVDAEPPWSAWRATALSLAAEAQLLTGDTDRATTLFTEAAGQGAAMGNGDAAVDSEAELGLLAMDDERWEDASEHVQRASMMIEDHRLQDHAVSMLTFAIAARLAMHRGDVADADRQLVRAMRVRPVCTAAMPYLAVRGRLQLARMQWARGRPGFARQLMREIDDVLLHRPALGTLIEQVTAFRTAMTYSDQVTAAGRSPLSPAELRLLPYLQTHLTLNEIGQRLFVSRNTVGTQVASIYRKLGVTSRSAAVEQATQIGLLGH